MTEKEIYEYNKLCANYIGLELGWWIRQEKPLTEDKKQWRDYYGKLFKYPLKTHQLKFHNDWNWIFTIYYKICYILVETKKTHPILNLPLSTPKEKIVQEIYNFLK